ncbi:MAG: S41 family peptidase [Gemmatimonadaceae bacterium]|jgi:hypothetical protein|nr:S41 family peptidase [Gemmatimonadaceae bacterium]
MHRLFGRRSHRRRAPHAIALCVFLAACSAEPAPVAPPPPTDVAQTAAYLDNVIRLMQTNSINRLRIDWAAFGTQVRAAATGARAVDELVPALRTALTLLGDGHSSFRLPSGQVLFVPVRQCAAATVPDATVPPTIGYVRVPAFSGTSAQASALAAGLRSGIQTRDVPGVVGWIVDPRGNGGGNMWPMVAGVGPVLGDGVIGHFIDPTGVTTVWEYQSGAARLAGSDIQRVTTPYVLRASAPPVAVLIDNRVASSGEAVAIAFKARANTRFFGSATCGLSTANLGFPLADGALLNLTVSTMADRNRVPFGEQVQPDERIVVADSAVSRAIEWLRSGR